MNKKEILLNFISDSRFKSFETGSEIIIFDTLTQEIYTFQGDETLPVLKNILNGSLEDLTETDLDFYGDFIEDAYNLDEKPYIQSKTRTFLSNLKLALSTKCNCDCEYCFKDTENKSGVDKNLVYKAIDMMIYDFGKEAVRFNIGTAS
jgi:sulfatase maturation enzyme AslB (radical SAM superfamily)